ncbi:MAG: SUMF1/EgtB/PvdO family nonheme iron enzyme [Verrucomicrobia bacterium]|nr:SUMF1/EgtB/PvdO family nonheme iron enzyme [Verrucomicrobiota bacterium]
MSGPRSSDFLLALPRRFNVAGFRIVRLLARGGFGITYAAEDLRSSQFVALKELFPKDSVTRERTGEVVARSPADLDKFRLAKARFIAEGQLLQRLRHPNIVRVDQVFEALGTAFLVMELIQGEQFADWLRIPGNAQEERLLGVLFALLSGLNYLHRKGALHRDISPDNILVTQEGRPVLIDFGNARALQARSVGAIHMIRDGYSPIEQYQTDAPQGPWTDIYALAAVMVFAVTRQQPRTATDRVNFPQNLGLGNFAYRSQYSPRFLQALERGFAVRPQQRPRSINQWRKTLPRPPRERRVSRFLGWPVLVGGLVVLAGVAAGLLLIFSNLSAPKPTPTPSPNAQPSASIPKSETVFSAQNFGPTNPYTNQLGMRFVPVITNAHHSILFCIHQTRIQDWNRLMGERAQVFWQEHIAVGIDAQGQPMLDGPVTTVTYDDAVAFCQRLTQADPINGKPGARYRLPSLEEWTTALGTGPFPWPPISGGKPLGNYLDKSAQTLFKDQLPEAVIPDYDDGFPTTAPVMHFPPNRLGLYDFGSNVEEWCSDQDGGFSFRKGASWKEGRRENIPTPPKAVRVDPTNALPWVGFRCVLDVP